jgi:hypothetical protein
MDITVNSTGSASFNLSGTNPAFTFLFRTNITPGTLGSGYNALNVTATLSSTNAVQIGSIFDFTTAGSGGGAIQVGLLFNLNAGYTGSNTTVGASYVNAVAGTGNNLNITAAVTAPTGNAGAVYYATATTTGLNYGTFGDAENGNLNIGLIGRAVIAKNSATNIGVLGVGLNTGTTPIQVGGYFGLHNATPTFESSALIADNGGTTSPIFLARDGGTTVFSVIDGGNTGVGITNPFGKLQVVGNGQGLYISFDNSVQASSYYTTIIPAWLSGSDSQTIHSINRIAGNTPTDMMWVGFYNSEVGVGINTATHNSTLQVEGSLSLSYVAKTSTYTATSADHTIDCTSGTFTVNLPTAVGIKGRIYVIKNTGTGVITVDGNSTETIDGATTQTLSVQYQSITIQSDNANWIII